MVEAVGEENEAAGGFPCRHYFTNLKNMFETFSFINIILKIQLYKFTICFKLALGILNTES